MIGYQGPDRLSLYHLQEKHEKKQLDQQIRQAVKAASAAKALNGMKPSASLFQLSFNTSPSLSGSRSLIETSKYSSRSSKRIPKRFRRQTDSPGGIRGSWHGNGNANIFGNPKSDQFVYSGSIVRPTEELNEAKGILFGNSTLGKRQQRMVENEDTIAICRPCCRQAEYCCSLSKSDKVTQKMIHILWNKRFRRLLTRNRVSHFPAFLYSKK